MYECRHSVGKRKRKAKSEIHRRSIFLSTPVTRTMLTWRMKNHIDLRASTALYSWMAYVWRKEQPLFPSITFLPCTSVDSHGRLDLDDFLREFRCFSYSVLRRPSESPLWLCRQFSLAIVCDGQWSRNKSIVDVDLLLKRGEYKKKKKKKNNPPRYQEKNNNRDNSGYDHTHTQGGTQSSNGPDRPWRIRRLPSVWGPYSLLPLFFFFCYSFCVVVRFVVDLLCCPCGLFRSITAVIDRFHFLAKDFILFFYHHCVRCTHGVVFYLPPVNYWILNPESISVFQTMTLHFFYYLNIIY